MANLVSIDSFPFPRSILFFTQISLYLQVTVKNQEQTLESFPLIGFFAGDSISSLNHHRTMGSSQSVQVDDDDDDEDDGEIESRELSNPLMKKVLEQEPEMLPCYASASPLSPQLSSLGTPRLGPSIKVWDPYNVLAPPPHLPPLPHSAAFSPDGMADDDRTIVEVFLISHGECQLNLRPDVVAGRCPGAALTPNGNRQARALAVFLISQGIRFNAVYTSPLDRARTTAVSVCQEMNFAEEQIQSSDALMEMGHGHWEGCLRAEIYTPEILHLSDRSQPDFSAPSGESLRQVEFRMVQFLNGTVLGLPEKLRVDFSSPHQNESHGFSNHNTTHGLTNSVHDLLHRNRQISRKKSGKSRLQFVTKNEDHEAEDEMSPRESHNHPSSSSSSFISSCIGIFTHAVPIKCLLTGLLGCSPIMFNKFCIDESSVTVLQHSWRSGWQIKRLNDTAHLRIL